MKNFLLFFCLSVCSCFAYSQSIPSDSAKYYLNTNTTVCGTITSTHVSGKEKTVTKLNFGDAFPNQSFTVVIFESDLAKFKYVPSEYLKNKNVCVTGLIKSYKERPEMIINSSEQIVEK